MAIPFLGRLNVAEYIALWLSFLLVGLEAVIRIATLAIPSSLLPFFYGASRRLFHRWERNPLSRASWVFTHQGEAGPTAPSDSAPLYQETKGSINSTASSPSSTHFPDTNTLDGNTTPTTSLDDAKTIRDASDFTDLCRIHGYRVEEHIVQTKDGYLLGVHRLAWRHGEEHLKVNHHHRHLGHSTSRSNSHTCSASKPVVYLHHGLLMNSEVWVCHTEKQRSLAFILVDRGFDVWLGNNRGNKYSKKCLTCPPTSPEFWNFSMDEFAFHDIPDTIAYILDATAQPSLSYIGFSQGTAQAFAALAIHPKLNTQVNVFIALAPAMSPAGLSNGVVDALVKASPQVLFLLFGRRSILSSATMWQSILYPPLFIRMIDHALSFLFDWQTRNISLRQKLAAYPHLYSFTSTKSVVHWFQIIRNKCFQMFDDDVQQPLAPLGVSSSSKYTKVAKYPTRNIKTPVVLIYGGSDSLVDIDVMLRELPDSTVATCIPHFEHLDFLWAREVHSLVFPHVFDALEAFTDAHHTREEYERFRRARESSLQHLQSQENAVGGVKARKHDTAIPSDGSVNDSTYASESGLGDPASPASPSRKLTEKVSPQSMPFNYVSQTSQSPSIPQAPQTPQASYAPSSPPPEASSAGVTPGSFRRRRSSSQASSSSSRSHLKTSEHGITIGASRAVQGIHLSTSGPSTATSNVTSLASPPRNETIKK